MIPPECTNSANPETLHARERRASLRSHIPGQVSIVLSGRTFVAVSAAAVVSIVACSESSTLGPIDQCSAGPSAAALVPPLFDKPFTGNYAVTNIFDHDEPLSTTDRNDFQLSTCGQKIRTPMRGHNGYDFPMPLGTPILAVSEGAIALAGLEPPIDCPALGKRVSGLSVVIRVRATPAITIDAIYGHLDSVNVKFGDSVRVGDVVGFSGNTGCSTGPHLHFAAARVFGRRGEVMIDPYGWNGTGSDPWAVDPRGTTSVWLWKQDQAPMLYRP
jgi:murein DD-endopeptidase MepM/ murein hydrolase activator NlpD